jgi:hypothetical protein
VHAFGLFFHSALGRLDMRALNSGRRWGSDVPSMRDILRIVELLHEKQVDRSNVLNSICDRVENVNTSFITVNEVT